MLKNTINMTLTCGLDSRAFFGVGDVGVFHTEDLVFSFPGPTHIPKTRDLLSLSVTMPNPKRTGQTNRVLKALEPHNLTVQVVFGNNKIYTFFALCVQNECVMCVFVHFIAENYRFERKFSCVISY
jgi:hypothetical protein